jgi:enoyl-CoA hydratase
MNALSTGLRVELSRCFRELRQNPAVRVAILTGSGRAFCAGMDLKELGDGDAGAPSLDNCREGLDVDSAIAEFEGPVIAAVNGAAIAGGFELALLCDIIIASTTAWFADTHARVGFLPGWGLSQRLPHLVGIARAKELCYTGNKIDARTACAWGLVNRVTEPFDLLSSCRTLGGQMADCVPEALRAYKRLINASLALPLPEALRYEANVAQEFGRGVRAADVAARRDAIFERGRNQ